MPAIIALFEWVSSELSQNRKQSYARQLQREFWRAPWEDWTECCDRNGAQEKNLIIDLGVRLGYFAGRPCGSFCPSRVAHSITPHIAKE
jgi:hypothetical protein